jgi:hypothetical protein
MLPLASLSKLSFVPFGVEGMRWRTRGGGVNSPF